MDLSIVERLVCPEAHASTPLVVRADRVLHGRLIDGLLGCPLCTREWPVENGVARFGEPTSMSAVPFEYADALAALLDLREPSIVVVDGVDELVIETLVSRYAATIIAIDGDKESVASVVQGASRVPVAAGLARSLALLRPGRDPAFVSSAVASVSTGGRVLAPESIPLVDGLQEMAREDGLWLAAREAVPVPVTLRRRSD